MGKRWVPLEANPEVLNKYAQSLGLDTSKLAFCDVFSLEEDQLGFVPQPVHAVLLLFPPTAEQYAAAAKVDKQQAEAGVAVDPSLFYMKQTIRNACGTIGVLHAIGNNQQAGKLRKGSFFHEFFEATAAMSAPERGAFLEEPPAGAPSVEEAHAEAASEGVTEARDEDVTPHYVVFVNHKNRLLELDGNKAFPVDHGPTSETSLLQDAIVVVKKFMEAAPTIHFNMIALSPPHA